MKLSKTMQAVMDELHKADWYYKHESRTGGNMYFANEDKLRHIGFESSAIVEGGHVYGTMSSGTLRALESRGLIKVLKDGNRMIDVVDVVDMELPEKLKTAIHVKVTRYWDGRKQEKYGYAVSKDAIKHLLNYFDSPPGVIITGVEILGEVELTVWDYFKNK